MALATSLTAKPGLADAAAPMPCETLGVMAGTGGSIELRRRDALLGGSGARKLPSVAVPAPARAPAGAELGKGTRADDDAWLMWCARGAPAGVGMSAPVSAPGAAAPPIAASPTVCGNGEGMVKLNPEATAAKPSLEA